eukprot:scaffold302988_cov21-Tisochrysis_lutea.AAC.1
MSMNQDNKPEPADIGSMPYFFVVPKPPNPITAIISASSPSVSSSSLCCRSFCFFSCPGSNNRRQSSLMHGCRGAYSDAAKGTSASRL